MHLKNDICFRRLMQIFANIGAVWYGSTLYDGKASKTFQPTTKADDFCCDWRFKGYILAPCRFDKKRSFLALYVASADFVLPYTT